MTDCDRRTADGEELPSEFTILTLLNSEPIPESVRMIFRENGLGYRIRHCAVVLRGHIPPIQILSLTGIDGLNCEFNDDREEIDRQFGVWL